MVSEQDVRALLRDGIDMAKSGDKKLAHTLLAQATRLDPQNENAWLWLAGVAHNYTEAADCLQHVLSLNPYNQTAIKGLARLGIKTPAPEAAVPSGNGSKPYPTAYHEAETVRSSSSGNRSMASYAGITVPTSGRLQHEDRAAETDLQLDRMIPVSLDQAQDFAVGTAESNLQVEEPRQILRVLVVDDSPTIRKLVAMTLGKHGYEVVSAADGMEALARINDGAPDLILLDITMPRMDGYQLCKTIKGNETTDHIPIVMLTGKDGFMDKVRGRMVGSEGYLTKPFNPDELVRMVKQHVGPA